MGDGETKSPALPCSHSPPLVCAPNTRRRATRLKWRMTRRVYFRARACFNGSHAPPCLLLLTDCWMKYIPSTPSFTFG